MQLPGEFSPFIEKSVFLLSGRGGLPLPTPLVVRPLKKNHFFYVCLPLMPPSNARPLRKQLFFAASLTLYTHNNCYVILTTHLLDSALEPSHNLSKIVDMVND